MNALRNVCARLARLFERLAGHGKVISPNLRAFSTTVGSVEVTLLLDRPRRLRFTMAEAAAFHRRTGISVWQKGVDVYELEAQQLVELLAICAHHEDPEVTPEGIAAHLSGKRLVDAVAAAVLLTQNLVPFPTDQDLGVRHAALLRLGVEPVKGPVRG